MIKKKRSPPAEIILLFLGLKFGSDDKNGHLSVILNVEDTLWSSGFMPGISEDISGFD